MIADYETLKLIWWGLVGVLLIGFALTDGFDMGVGALLPLLGKNDEQRRVIINTVGPIGKVIRSGLLPQVALCLPPGRWCTPVLFPVCTQR